MSKQCFKCGECKPLSEFYKHPKMADGHVNKCKPCNKLDVRTNRKEKVEYYRDYDKSRERRGSSEETRRYREENPKKYKAHGSVNNAVRDGRLFKQPCEICGSSRVVGHHDDYDKPLEVRWLCTVHHAEWHKEHGEGRNAH